MVNLKPGKMYKFCSYVKQLNDMPGKMFQKYRANVAFTWKDDGKMIQKYGANVAFTWKDDGKVIQKYGANVAFTWKDDTEIRSQRCLHLER